MDDLGPYKVTSVLGRGGMGIVYLGEHRESGERVALKTLRRVEAPTLAAIRREVHALSRILHPGIVRIVGHGDEEGLPWYAMELVDGVPLRTFVPRHSLDDGASVSTIATNETFSRDDTVPLATGRSGAPREPQSSMVPDRAAAGGQLARALALVRRLCPILAYLHGEGFVHRDLKPDNVLVRSDGSVVVVDFGLLQASTTGREVLATTDALAGTVAYMAPEQLRGGIVDGRADLYALGCILFELLVGHAPFVGRDPADTIGLHLSAPPPSPSAQVRDVPPALDELTARLLAKEPRERLGHADLVSAALDSLGVETESRPRILPPTRSYLYRSRLVGRERPVQALNALLDRAAGGTLAIALLSGESGVGKTRLASELALAAQERGFHVAAAEGSRPDLPVPPLHALRPLLRLVADACLASGSAQHARLLGPRGRILAPQMPELATLPGHDEHPEPMELPPPQARERLFSALVETLRRLADDAPVLAVVDDLQWTDELSLAFLSFLEASKGAATLPLLLLATYRTDAPDDVVEELRGRPSVVELPIGRLDPPAVGELVSELLALQPPPQDLVAFLAGHSEGNPLFVAEYLRSAVDERLLSRDGRGRWTAASAGFDRLGLPASLQELLPRRLSTLGPGATRLLEVFAVIGSAVDADLLASAGPPDLVALQELLRRQILLEEPPGSYRFLHERIREVAYDRVEPERRAALHAAAAAGLEERSAPLAAVARHWELAGERARAADTFRRAGFMALEQGALDAGAQLLGASLRLTELPTRQSVHARNDRAFRALRPRGRVKEALAEHERAREEATSLDAPDLVIFALTGAAACHQRLGSLDAAERCYEESLRAANASGLERPRAMVLGNLGALHQDRGQTALALRLTEESIAVLRSLGLSHEIAVAQQNLAVMHMAEGRVARAEALYLEAREAHRQSGHRYYEGFVLANLGVLQAQLGRLREARSTLDAAIELTRDSGDRHLGIAVRINLCIVHQELGDLGAAGSELEAALELAREMDTPGEEAEVRMELALTSQLAGRAEEAEEHARMASAVASRGAHPAHLREVNGGLARLAMERGDLAEARRIMAEAEGHDAAVTGLPRAVVDVFRAQLHLASGDLPRAVASATAAAAVFRPIRSLLRLADCLVVLGGAAVARGDAASVAEARTFLHEARALLRESGCGACRSARDLDRLAERLDASGDQPARDVSTE